MSDQILSVIGEYRTELLVVAAVVLQLVALMFGLVYFWNKIFKGIR